MSRAKGKFKKTLHLKNRAYCFKRAVRTLRLLIEPPSGSGEDKQFQFLFKEIYEPLRAISGDPEIETLVEVELGWVRKATFSLKNNDS